MNGDLSVVPRSRLRVVWNPLGWANPPVPGNAPAKYYPGDAYVDVVGGDVYKTPTNVGHMTALEDLDKAHPNKPFSIPEWGLQGVDDPDFVDAAGRVRADASAHRGGRAVLQAGPVRPADEAAQPRGLPLATRPAGTNGVASAGQPWRAPARTRIIDFRATKEITMALSFGVTVLPDPPYSRFLELIVLAESHGFEYGWTYDSHVLWQESSRC